MLHTQQSVFVAQINQLISLLAKQSITISDVPLFTFGSNWLVDLRLYVPPDTK